MDFSRYKLINHTWFVLKRSMINLVFGFIMFMFDKTYPVEVWCVRTVNINNKVLSIDIDNTCLISSYSYIIIIDTRTYTTSIRHSDQSGKELFTSAPWEKE